MVKRFTKKTINELIGSPTDISGIESGSKTSFTEVAFNLYRETSTIVISSSHIFESYSLGKGRLSINQAICVGLLVRIAKFMASILALMCDGVREHGEVIMCLNRCIIESAMKLRFFCERASKKDFDDFIKSSLKPEKDLYNSIQDNIKKRGKTLPIEKRKLNSINRVLEYSGISGIDELSSIPRRKNYKEILKSIGMESNYNMFQEVPSHSIHGSWVDLALHNLKKDKIGFMPNPDPVHTDPRLLCPINMIILTALRSYLNKYFTQNHEGLKVLLARIDDLIERNKKADELHEKNLSSSKEEQE